jgi:hypothetical protein
VIRHYDGTNGEAIGKQARAGRIFALSWTWKGHRIVMTKKEGARVMRVWKRRHEELGFHVVSAPKGHDGYLAYAPDVSLQDWTRHGPRAKIRSIALHEYTPTLQRVWPKEAKA